MSHETIDLAEQIIDEGSGIWEEASNGEGIESEDYRDVEAIQLCVAIKVAILKLPLLIQEITLSSSIKLKRKD